MPARFGSKQDDNTYQKELSIATAPNVFFESSTYPFSRRFVTEKFHFPAPTKRDLERMLSVTMLLSVALVVVAQGVEEEIPMCINSNTQEQILQFECPARVVCGHELWNLNWDNGKICRDYRTVIKCVCPGNTPCPVQNQRHVFYFTDKHMQYLCEPRCDVGMCSSYTTAAIEWVHNSPDFHRYDYYKINCRCPGHNEHMTRQQYERLKEIHYNQMHFNNTISVTSTLYKCAGDEPLHGADTDCGGSRARRGRLGLLGEEEDSWA